MSPKKKAAGDPAALDLAVLYQGDRRDTHDETERFKSANKEKIRRFLEDRLLLESAKEVRAALGEFIYIVEKFVRAVVLLEVLKQLVPTKFKKTEVDRLIDATEKFLSNTEGVSDGTWELWATHIGLNPVYHALPEAGLLCALENRQSCPPTKNCGATPCQIRWCVAALKRLGESSDFYNRGGPAKQGWKTQAAMDFAKCFGSHAKSRRKETNKELNLRRRKFVLDALKVVGVWWFHPRYSAFIAALFTPSTLP